MGVLKLWEVLQDVKQEVKLEEAKGLTLAVDLATWICESEAVKPLKNCATPPYLRNLFFRVTCTLKAGINLIFVLDGKAPQLKLETIAKRIGSSIGSPKKSSGIRCRLNAKMKECCKLLDSLGVPWIKAESEAEALCATLNKVGLVDAIITNDSDVFLYGARTVYRRFSVEKNGVIEKYSIEDVRRDLGLDQKHLIALGLLLGCDYCPKGVRGVGVKQAMKLLGSFGSTDALSVFSRWRNSGQNLSTYDDVKKQAHCSTCRHEGALRDHCKSGCPSCGEQCATATESAKKVVCQCRWHKSEEKRIIYMLEEKIKGLALQDPKFPDQGIITEFLEPQKYMDPSEKAAMKISENHAALKERFKIDSPKLDDACNYLKEKMGWTFDNALRKVLPALTRFILCNPSRPSDQVRIDSVRKARVKDQVPSLEIKWTITVDSLALAASATDLITLEPEEDVNRVFPGHVAEFYKRIENEKEEKKAAKAEERKARRKQPKGSESSDTASQSSKITDFFKVRKPRDEGKASIPKLMSRQQRLSGRCLIRERNADARDLKSSEDSAIAIGNGKGATVLRSTTPTSSCASTSRGLRASKLSKPIIIFSSDSGDSDPELDVIATKFGGMNLCERGRPAKLEGGLLDPDVANSAASRELDLSATEITFGSEINFSLGCSLLCTPATVRGKENHKPLDESPRDCVSNASLVAVSSKRDEAELRPAKLPLSEVGLNYVPAALKIETPEKSPQRADAADSPIFMTLMERLEARKKLSKS